MPSSVELVCIDPRQVHALWPHARKFIEAAARRTKLTPFSEIEDAVLGGDELLWLALDGKTIEAAATTRLIAGDERPVCVLTACGGDRMDRWLPLFSEIEEYAKNEGCSCVRIYGRKGWARVLAGYQTKHVILERPL